MSDEIVLSYEDSLLRQSDVRLLDEPNWLNDRIIGFCFQYYEYDLYNSADIAYISPDVTQLIKLSPTEELDILLSSLDLKSKKLIFFAVNSNLSLNQAGGSHWSLLVFENQEFFHYDSMNASNRHSALLMARQMAAHLGVALKFTDAECPQQRGSHECGMYVVCCTEYLCRKKLGLVDIPLHDAVTASSVAQKRHELKRVIGELAAR